jgi:hypothetical protein
MLKVLEHILMSRPVEQLQCNAYNDAVKELQTDGMYELQRLASKMPDQLLVICPIKQIVLVLTIFDRMFMTNSKQKSTRSFPQELWIPSDRSRIKHFYSPSCALSMIPLRRFVF